MAYEFVKASSQYLSVPDTATLDITGAITLVCWAKRNADLSTAQNLIAKYFGPDQRSYIMQINTSGLLISRFARDGTANFLAAADSTSLVPTGWSHLATSWTPNVADAIIYINGISGWVSVGGVTNAVIHSGTADLVIGASSLGNSAYFGGLIAEVGIWDAALTADEIASLANGMTCDKVRPQNLVFYAPLVRDLQDVRGGLTITNNNTATVATHPRVYA
jgi:hypothetical protein